MTFQTATSPENEPKLSGLTVAFFGIIHLLALLAPWFFFLVSVRNYAVSTLVFWQYWNLFRLPSSIKSSQF